MHMMAWRPKALSHDIDRCGSVASLNWREREIPRCKTNLARRNLRSSVLINDTQKRHQCRYGFHARKTHFPQSVIPKKNRNQSSVSQPQTPGGGELRMSEAKTARVPMSYDTGSCEGRKTSPSNPSDSTETPSQKDGCHALYHLRKSKTPGSGQSRKRDDFRAHARSPGPHQAHEKNALRPKSTDASWRLSTRSAAT